MSLLSKLRLPSLTFYSHYLRVPLETSSIAADSFYLPKSG
jgi:hypothetical protein